MENGSTFNENRSNDDKIDDCLMKSLKTHGFIFSDTEDEIEEFYLEFLLKKTSLPHDLRDSSSVFKASEAKEAKVFNLPPNRLIVENLAQAARDGSNISDEILEKMKRDRIASEESKKS